VYLQFEHNKKIMILHTKKKQSLFFIFIVFGLISCNTTNQSTNTVNNETGYDMWLRYEYIENEDLRSAYQKYDVLFCDFKNPIIQSSIDELALALRKLTQTDLKITQKKEQSSLVLQIDKTLNKDGYSIKNIDNIIYISGQSDAGILYGTFAFIRQLQFQRSVENIFIEDYPRVNMRMLNHWDNISGDIERGYAGGSIWNWEKLPESNQRYVDYARFLASVGINGTVINNVNAQTEILRTDYIKKYKGLSDIFNRYGIKLFVSINFASPMQLGNLPNADPLNPNVEQWWKNKIDEIYSIIPNFGGFLVKADSEWQPGPHIYGRTHAQGANMLARNFKKYNGIVIWRAFVYGISNNDRAKQAYEFFQPQDGKFDENVILQVKNGPIDFQVNEPLHPLFGAMPKTNQMAELQITQEYTGRQIALNYLLPFWKKFLFTDTYRKGKGSEVYKVVNGELYNQHNTGICGVSNIGSDINWTGHHLAQANFYGFGRLAWNPQLSVEDITEEWIRLTFGNNKKLISVINDMLMQSHGIYAMNQVPFGTGYFFNGDRINPSPNIFRLSVHKSDTLGIGYDRTTKTGSGYVDQYAPELAKLLNNPQTTPEGELLFFHHLPYNYKLKSGKNLIQQIYDYQFQGVEKSKMLLDKWKSIENKIDAQRFREVKQRLEQQLMYASKWQNNLVSFFYSLSNIDDEKGRIPQNTKEEININRFLNLLDENKNIPVFTLPESDSVLTIEAEKMHLFNPYTIKNENNIDFIGIKQDRRSSFKTLYESGFAICKFKLPRGKVINYYDYSKVFDVTIRSNRNELDTIWVKIGDFDFEPWIENFYSEDWKKHHFKTIGVLLGNGTHPLIIKGLKDGIEIDNIKISRGEYFLDQK